MENRYKKIREDFEFTKHGYRITADKLAEIFKERGYSTLTGNAIRKIETDKRYVSEVELKAYREVFNTTSDYLLGFTNDPTRQNDRVSASNLTGLSSEAIDCLNAIKQKSPQSIDILNAIRAYLKEDNPEFLKHIKPRFSVWHYIATIPFCTAFALPVPFNRAKADKAIESALADWNKKTNNQKQKWFKSIAEEQKLINEEHSAEGLDNQAK